MILPPRAANAEGGKKWRVEIRDEYGENRLDKTFKRERTVCTSISEFHTTSAKSYGSGKRGGCKPPPMQSSARLMSQAVSICGEGKWTR